MAKERLSMRKIKEALRLRFECRLPYREIGLSCEASISTIGDYYRRAQAAGRHVRSRLTLDFFKPSFNR
jgi:hypothetical protein